MKRWIAPGLLASGLLVLGAAPATALNIRPGEIGVHAQTSSSSGCFSCVPVSNPPPDNKNVDGVGGRASAESGSIAGGVIEGGGVAGGRSRSDVDEPAGTMSVSASASANDLSSANSMAAGVVDDTITLSAPATVVLEGTASGSASFHETDFGRSSSGAALDVYFHGPFSEQPTPGCECEGGHFPRLGGFSARWSGELGEPNGAFAVSVDLPAGTTFFNAWLRANASAQSQDLVAGGSSGNASGSVSFRIVLPAGVTAVSGSGFLPIGGTAPPPLPALSIDDVTLPEGNSGAADAVLTVRLSTVATEPVSVGVATADDTATAGSDYTATQTTLQFAVGETARDVRVPVIGDAFFEPDERFRVNLSDSTGATIADGQGQATIVNDDQAQAEADLELTASPQTAAPLRVGEPIKLLLTVKNNGPQPATAPVLRYGFVDATFASQPSSVIEVVSIEPAATCADAGSSVTECALPPAASGDGTQVLLTVVAHRAGQYAAILEAASRGAETDPNGGNNRRELLLDVQPRTADLELIAAIQTAAPLRVGEPIKLAVTVKNNGPQPATLPVLRYAFVDESFAPQPTSVVDVVAVEPALACADAGSNMTDCGIPPAATGGGTQLLLTVVVRRQGRFAAVLEARNGAESDPNGTNNGRELLLDVQTARPDLMPSALTVPDWFAVGSGSAISWTLRNVGGPLAAASFVDRFYLSTDPWLDPGDRLIGARLESAGMAAGSERTAIVDAFVPGDTPLGSYYLIGVADHGNAISESDEQNNTRAVAVAVVAERVEEPVLPGGSLTTDAESDGATAADPIEVTISTPSGGFVSIDEGPGGATPPANFEVLGSAVRITAPVETSQQPLRLTFVLDGSLLPTDGSVVHVLRNGTVVSDCSSAGVATPDPCVESRAQVFGDDLAIVVLTSAASDWVLGVPRDAAPPQVVVPIDLAVNATSPAGAAVTYSASASDDADPSPDVVCAPASGGTFAIGRTTVTCTATDWVGKTTSGSFVVTVRGAPAQIVELIQKTLAMLNQPLLEATLQAQLEQAATTLIAGNKPYACRLLSLYIAAVRLQSGRALTTAQAAELVADAQRIKAVIGC